MDVSKLTTAEIAALQQNAATELERRLDEKLEEAAQAYFDAMGTEDGLKELTNTLIYKIAEKRFPGGRYEFARHLQAILQ